MDQAEAQQLKKVVSNPAVGMFAAEARNDFEKRDPWFFLHQASIACEHLTEVEHCEVETIEYAGVHNGRHVWLGHS